MKGDGNEYFQHYDDDETSKKNQTNVKCHSERSEILITFSNFFFPENNENVPMGEWNLKMA